MQHGGNNYPVEKAYCLSFLSFCLLALVVECLTLKTLIVKPCCMSFTTPLMPDKSAPEIELIRTVYAAFNARDIDAALALMTPDVAWPKAFKGGFVRGSEEVRAYWTQQWSEINPHVEPVAFHPEDAGQVLVEVHQVVRSLTGAVLADEHVGHRFTIEHALIQTMEICPPPLSGH